jgi:hypothetical protein
MVTFFKNLILDESKQINFLYKTNMKEGKEMISMSMNFSNCNECISCKVKI